MGITCIIHFVFTDIPTCVPKPLVKYNKKNVIVLYYVIIWQRSSRLVQSPNSTNRYLLCSLTRPLKHLVQCTFIIYLYMALWDIRYARRRRLGATTQLTIFMRFFSRLVFLDDNCRDIHILYLLGDKPPARLAV